MLEATGVPLVVRRAETVRGALVAIAAAAPDVLLLDLHLPDAEGAEAVDAIMAAAPMVPVVVLTASVDEKLHLRAVRSGAENVVSKLGLEPRSLRRDLLFALERGRARQGVPASEAVTGDGSELLTGVTRGFQESLAELRRNRGDLREELQRLEQSAQQPITPESLQDVILELRSILDDDEAALERVSGIVAGLSALANVDEVGPIDMTELLEELCERVSPSVEQRAALMTDIEDDLVVDGNAARLVLAVEHLVANATQAFTGGAPQDNSVSITAEEEDGFVLIEVWDDGHEVPSGLAIERPFVSGWGRLGLGLTLAHEIALRHDGTLTWASTPEGTTFVLRLPCSPSGVEG
jgi:signal transduction histidine kinase